MLRWFKLFPILALLGLAACSGSTLPANVRPVSDFQLDRYLGKWYEIARLDHRFERGLDKVSAEYSLREDGGVRVINRGFNTATGKWQQAEGRAYFVENPQIGHLKVSFFGPFYGAYGIFELDPDYRYALVSGPDTSYLWLLARTPRIDTATREALLTKAAALGFDTNKLIFPAQD